ncbi:uncharacterized protein BP01DRAFT_359275 [Aspergillus saccharolyticus JOP 1030-1]|uniref:Uncharacterized protein n=1 Tax=Aspergillus saccharolyticus JOP 1030-1 TaxID=1450539 RepID=A0A318Z5K5_9EURO|nr:hypothetical protein BP01DRAFT_359275 [Aspergillus saccharolyticus JOP 1030-1]PYH42591.1 hypothetical protein BP01DRAFT_359275 [Aspergillus saccharolyticus JOP 1030-1]
MTRGWLPFVISLLSSPFILLPPLSHLSIHPYIDSTIYQPFPLLSIALIVSWTSSLLRITLSQLPVSSRSL